MLVPALAGCDPKKREIAASAALPAAIPGQRPQLWWAASFAGHCL